MRNSKGQFTKGRTETTDERKKRVLGVIAAWKNRPDYHGYDKSKGSMFNSWRAKIYTAAGKRIGYPQEWKSFESFKDDMGSGWFQGAVLVRIDQSKPYSKDNCAWARKGSENHGRAILLEYNGEVHSMAEWGEILGMTRNQIYLRYRKRNQRGYSIKEILYGRRREKSRPPKDISEVELKRAKVSKMISSYRAKDYRNGFQKDDCDLTVDWMLDHIVNQPCFYCGDTHRIGCDRVDNKKPHSKNNVVPCCIECNVARSDKFTVNEMLIIGKAIRQVKDERNKSENT